MKKIIFEETDQILFKDVNEERPIFARKIGCTELCGMIVKEPGGWILRTGSDFGAAGFHNTLKECLTFCINLSYEFIIY